MTRSESPERSHHTTTQACWEIFSLCRSLGFNICLGVWGCSLLMFGHLTWPFLYMCVYDSVANVPESWVWLRADFQSGSRVSKKGVLNLILSISMAYNVISCRKVAENTQILCLVLVSIYFFIFDMMGTICTLKIKLDEASSYKRPFGVWLILKPKAEVTVAGAY